jgi:predicted dehydrogenase
VCTDWASHVPIALQAMNNGKHVAIEVPAATTLDDCWALVDAAERTRCHCTMLENCCYASCHLGTMAATRRGRMGTIVHVEGAYIHPIGDRWTPWRTEANQQLRGDLYPTHGMGPACQLLDIHRTDWIETLVSMDTEPFLRTDFRNGDHTTTLMRTRLGKTILLQHNVVDPHEYTRRYHVVGTLKSVESSDSTPHDQMSRRMDRRLVHCLHQGLPLDIDVYDLAEWCAVSELSRLSIENGNVPVAFPDFTRSKIW